MRGGARPRSGASGEGSGVWQGRAGAIVIHQDSSNPEQGRVHERRCRRQVTDLGDAGDTGGAMP